MSGEIYTMQDNAFHLIIINRSDHRLIMADYDGYPLLQNDIFSPFEEYLDQEDRPEFLQALEQENHEWHLVHMPGEDGINHHVAFRILGRQDADRVHMLLVRVRELLERHEKLSLRMAAFDAIRILNEDIYFIFSPANQTVTVYGSRENFLDKGPYTPEAFEEALGICAGESAKLQIHNILQHLKEGTRRFSEDIPQNLVSGDLNAAHTLIRGTVVYHHGEAQESVGIIHLCRQEELNPVELYTRDQLTGLLGKNDITGLAKERISRGNLENTTIGIIDIDFFKNVNDTYGHRRGDDVIRETAGIIEEEVGNTGAAGRIGGDEFLVVLNTSEEAIVRKVFGNIKNMVRAAFPGMGPGGNTPVTVTIGGASYPVHAENYDDLFTLADFCLYRGKEKGRNRYIYYVPAKHGSLEEIKARKTLAGETDSREENGPADFIVNAAYRLHYGEKPELHTLLDEFSLRFQIPCVMLYSGEEGTLKCIQGTHSIEKPEQVDAVNAFVHADLSPLLHSGMVVLNNIESLPGTYAAQEQNLLQQDIHSVLILDLARHGGKGMLAFVCRGHSQTWNQLHFKYYRLLAELLCEYDPESLPLFVLRTS